VKEDKKGIIKHTLGYTNYMGKCCECNDQIHVREKHWIIQSIDFTGGYSQCINCHEIMERLKVYVLDPAEIRLGKLKKYLSGFMQINYDGTISEYGIREASQWFSIKEEKLNQLFGIEQEAAKRPHIAKRSKKEKEQFGGFLIPKSSDMAIKINNLRKGTHGMLLRDGVDPATFIIPEPEPPKPYPSRLNNSEKAYTDDLYARIFNRKMTPG